MNSELYIPSSMTGFARNQSESKYPAYWQGLVGYWDFSVQGVIPVLGRALDLSGKGNHGKLEGDTYSVPGLTGPALSFDGTGDSIAISQIVLGGDFSIIFLAKPNVITSYQIITDHIGQVSSKGGICISDPAGWRLRETVEDGGTSLFVPITIGSWQLIVFTQKGGTTTGYKDGVFVTSASLSPLAVIDRFGLGADINEIGYDGLIDNILIYNRALTADQIAFLYSHPKALVTPRDYPILRVVGGATYLRTINDSLGVADSEISIKTFSRTITESMGVTDATTKVSASVRILAEALGITDATVKAETKVLAEALGITDVTTKAEGKVLAETLGLTDTTVRTFVILRTFAESLGLTDAITKISVFSRILAEALGITDAMSRTQVQTRIISESLGITDEILRVQVQLRIIAETLGLTDVMQRGQIITFADSLGITDDVSRLVNYITTQSDDIGIADAIVRVAVALRTVTDDIGITDDMSIAELVKAAWAFMIIRQTHN